MRNTQGFLTNSLLGIAISVMVLMKTSHAETAPIPVKEIQRFTAAISQIKNYYVDTVKDEKLFDEAIRGMLAGLDPHSAYLDEEELKELQDATSGEFSGLGLEVIPDSGVLKVISPIDDTPAQKAGIKAGDLIIRINKEMVNKMTMREAIVKMRGKSGTFVTLTIARKNAPAPMDIKVERKTIKVKSVKGRMLAKGYGYIRISSFQTNTEPELIKMLKGLMHQAGGQLRGLVLDLRNNPGGLLDSAVDVSNLFLDSRKLGHERFIVYTKGRFPAAQFQAKATAQDMLHGAPMVILINGGSASGAEIVAGALQDHKRAVLMGTNSFGKGSVQTVLPLDGKSAIKLTTALYYTPAGRSIQAKGIHPDVEITRLTMPAEKGDKLAALYLKESDLRGHINNGDAKKDDAVVATLDNSEEEEDNASSLGSMPSVKTDYQLHEALNLLRGMAITRHA